MKKICTALVGVVLISLMIVSNVRVALAGVFVKKVLIDARTGLWSTQFGEYAGAIDILEANGYTVDLVTSGSITSDLLSGYCCFVIVCGDQGYSTAEQTAILNFIAGGGGLLFLGEHSGSFTDPSAEYIAEQLGVTIQHNVLYDETNFWTNTFWPLIHTFPTGHPVTNCVTQFVYGCGATLVVTSPAETIATGDDDSHNGHPTPIDSATAEEDLGPGGSWEPMLAVSTYGNGKAVITADSNLFDSSYFNGIEQFDNAILWLNIFLWLCPPIEHVIPEVPFGTILASASMIMGLLGFFLIPKLKRKQNL